MEALCRVREIVRAISDFESRFQEVHGISLNEGMLLCSLSRSAPCTSGQLAAAMGLSASNTSKVLAAAEKKQLIQRSLGCEDKRCMLFSLSEQGKTVLDTIRCNERVIGQVLESIGQLVTL